MLYHRLLTPLEFERVISSVQASAACFDQQVGREIQSRNEDSNFASDGSLVLANSFLKWN